MGLQGLIMCAVYSTVLSLITMFFGNTVGIVLIFLNIPLYCDIREVLPGWNLKLRDEDCLVKWEYSKADWSRFLQKGFKFPSVLYWIQHMSHSRPCVQIFNNGIKINGLIYPLKRDSIDKALVYHYTVNKVEILNKENMNILEITYYGSDIKTVVRLKVPIPLGEEENAEKIKRQFSFSYHKL